MAQTVFLAVGSGGLSTQKKHWHEELSMLQGDMLGLDVIADPGAGSAGVLTGSLQVIVDSAGAMPGECVRWLHVLPGQSDRAWRARGRRSSDRQVARKNIVIVVEIKSRFIL